MKQCSVSLIICTCETLNQFSIISDKLNICCFLQAEQNVVTRSLNKEYAPIGGEGDFCKEAAKLAFGETSNVLSESRNITVQGISGTGSLRIGAELISKHWPGNKTIYLPKPSWGNHTPIFKFAGFNVGAYTYYDPSTCG